MGPSRAKGRIVVGGIVKKIRQQGMRPVLLREVGDQILQNLKVTSTPNKHWKASASCLMGMEWGMWSPSFLYFQPNKVKSGQYQQNNTYNKLIEPNKWQSNSDLNNMTNLLKLLTTKNVKAKLGKGGTAMQGNNNGGGVSQTFSFVVPYSMNHTNTGTSGTIKTAYPVKNTEKSTVKINSLINATPLNSYGYRYIFLFQPHPKVEER